MEILRCEGVRKTYGSGGNQAVALEGIDLIVEKGEFVTIIGASGSGKSTLLHILGSVDKPSAGKVTIEGTDLASLNAKQAAVFRRRKVGLVYQFYNLIPNLTALENVELPLIYRGVGKRERLRLADTALDKVGLGKRKTHKPSEMSGGQQQRVAIARAIAQAPPIILADEPTGNLDSGSSKEIMGILKSLHEEGRTVILITHDNEIAKQAKRVIKIIDGQIVQDSGAGQKPEQIKEPETEQES